MLPQLIESFTYKSFYANLSSSHYKILDTGAFEGEGMGGEELLNVAIELRAHEVVIPDVMGDSEATWEKMLEFAYHARLSSQFKYGFVIHTPYAEGGPAQLAELADPKYDWIDVVYLPKLLWKHDPLARLDLAGHIHQFHSKRFEVHMLGSVAEDPTEIIAAARSGFVRGIDTSLPFVESFYGNTMDVWTNGTRPKRPENYFALPRAGFNEFLVEKNIRTTKRWAMGIR
jgi:hypothetical protein